MLQVHGSFDADIALGNCSVPSRVYVLSSLQHPILSRQLCSSLRLIPREFPNVQLPCDNVPVVKTAVLDSLCSRNSRIPVPVTNVSIKLQLVESDLKRRYQTIFSGRVTAMPGEKFKILLREDAVPFAVNTPRRVAEPLKPKLKDELDSLEQQGIITPVTEPTEWCSPIAVVSKKNGQIRLCVDLRNVNKHVVRERFISPTPFEVVSTIPQGCKYFTLFDALKGYHQIPIDPQSQHLTTFITAFGRYKFLRAPFGISAISEHYNRRMSSATSGLKNTFHIVDDVLIADSDYATHVDNVNRFLQRCVEHNIALNPEKIRLAATNVEFAGFHLDQSGFRVSDELVRAIKDFPAPTNLTDLRSWFGLANQLGSSTKDLSELSAPLRPLLKKTNEFCWTDIHQAAFEQMREHLSRPPYLAHYDPARHTALYTDASRLNGIGFVLMQKQDDGQWRPVRAGSRFLSEAETRYAMIELELVAVAWAVKKCNLFLDGLPHFDIKTDHAPLVPILNKYTLDQIENPRLQRLRRQIDRYSFTAIWLRGKDNYAADALSRAPIDRPRPEDELGEEVSHRVCAVFSLASFSDDTDPLIEQISQAAKMDKEYQDLRMLLLDGFSSSKDDVPHNLRAFFNVKDKLALDGDLIVCGKRLLIPMSLRKVILSKLLSMHQGATKMKLRARASVYWPNLDHDIDQHCKTCQSCQSVLPS